MKITTLKVALLKENEEIDWEHVFRYTTSNCLSLGHSIYMYILYSYFMLKQFRSNRHIQVIMAADSKPFEDEVIQRELQRERDKIDEQWNKNTQEDRYITKGD